MGEWSHSCCDVGNCQYQLNIIFAFHSQRWVFHYFIWPTARVIVVLLPRLHRSRLKKFIPLWPVTLAICSELTIFVFFSFLTVVLLAQWLVNFFLPFFKASTSYGYFHYVSWHTLLFFAGLLWFFLPIGLVWTRCLNFRFLLLLR